MTLLFLGIEPSRTDFLKSIEPATKQAQCYFLEHFHRNTEDNSLAQRLGSVLYWSNYLDAFDLIASVKPDRIVYLLLDNYYHFAVFFTARALGIPIYYLDHGIRFEHEIDTMAKLDRGQHSLIQRLLRKSVFTPRLALAKNIFFRHTLKKLPREQRQQALSVFLSRSGNYFGDFMRKSGSLIVPDKIIAYSPETFSFFKRFFSLPKSWDSVTFTGIPSLDNLSYLANDTAYRPANGLLFIDQPLHEQRIAGWTKKLKKDFWKQLAGVAKAKGLHLYIKPHPWTKAHYGEVPSLDDPGVSIIEQLDEKICQEIAFAGSFNSTLLLAFCSSPSIACFCMEIHPQKLKPELSIGITKYGVAEALRSFSELSHFLEQRNIALTRKAPNLTAYLHSMLFLFDGKAKERVAEALSH